MNPRGELKRGRGPIRVVVVFPPGTYNAITDVAGVKVGHTTVIEGDSIRSDVTAIIPAEGDLYRAGAGMNS